MRSCQAFLCPAALALVLNDGNAFLVNVAGFAGAARRKPTSQNKIRDSTDDATGDAAALLVASSSSSSLSSSFKIHRRQFLWTNLGLCWGLVGTTSTSVAAVDSAQLQQGLLHSRVEENVLSPPNYGMEGPDVFYPPWFAGTWNIDSTTTDVQAPCGIALFGGNTTYSNAREDIGTTLRYSARFLPTKASTSFSNCIADREYNVKSIARAAMGSNSVLDVPLVSPNKFSIVLAPNGSPFLLRVDLFTLNRRQEQIDDTHFDCSEVVREIVAKEGLKASSSFVTDTLLKEVETTSIYTFNKDKTISCRQRSASFLLPSQSSAMAMKMWQASQGRPVDVRFYDVVYTKQE